MAHYVAIVEETGPDKAIGVWFPDLPGCFSAGDTMDEALVNAPDAMQLYAEALRRGRRQLPRARSMSELKADPTLAEDVRGNFLAVVQLPELSAAAAE